MIGDSDALEGHGHGATTTEAEGGEAVAAPAPPQLGGRGGHDARAAGADGVSQGDRAAVDVHLRPVEAELAAVGQHLGGEGLVDLDEVEVLDGHRRALEELAHALDRGEEEPLGGDLRLGVADDARERPQSVALHRALAGHDGGGGAVADAGRVAGRDRGRGAWPAPAFRAMPMKTSSMASSGTPARPTAARMAMPPRVVAGISARLPPNLPIGVRAAGTRKTRPSGPS